MPESDYFKKNMSLLRYSIGMLLLGSVAWMPFDKTQTYYFFQETLWIWLLSLLALLGATFALSTMLTGFLSFIPFRGWSYDKKFLRFFLIASLIIIPILAFFLIYIEPSRVIAQLGSE